MNKVVEFKIIKNYIVWIKFKDGFESEMDFKPFLLKGFSRELLDKEKFSTLFIEDGGGLAFENGFDFCPNHLRILLDSSKKVSLV